jgi:hypothetical protein
VVADVLALVLALMLLLEVVEVVELAVRVALRLPWWRARLGLAVRVVLVAEVWEATAVDELEWLELAPHPASIMVARTAAAPAKR